MTSIIIPKKRIQIKLQHCRNVYKRKKYSKAYHIVLPFSEFLVGIQLI